MPAIGAVRATAVGGLVLGILEAEELLLVVERDLDGPSCEHSPSRMKA